MYRKLCTYLKKFYITKEIITILGLLVYVRACLYNCSGYMSLRYTIRMFEICNMSL